MPYKNNNIDFKSSFFLELSTEEGVEYKYKLHNW